MSDHCGMATLPKALFFDVFGTLVDWRGSIAREARVVLEPLGHSLDWLAFADAWRGEYQGAMDEVRLGRIPFCKLDVLHRRNLEIILPRFKISGLSEDVMRHSLVGRIVRAYDKDAAKARKGRDPA